MICCILAKFKPGVVGNLDALKPVTTAPSPTKGGWGERLDFVFRFFGVYFWD